MLAINATVREIAQENIIKTTSSEAALVALERVWIGLDHAALGGLMLEGWEMPAATTDPLKADLVHVADILANHSGMGGFYQLISEGDDSNQAVFERLALAAEVPCEELLAKAEEQFIDTIYLLFG